MHREKPHKLLQVGDSHSRYQFVREVIRLPDCKSGVRKTKQEVTNWSVTSASHHFGLVAQSAERPVVCGKVEGATPLGSAIFFGMWLSLQSARLGTGRPQVEILPFRPISNCCRGRIHEASVF